MNNSNHAEGLFLFAKAPLPEFIKKTQQPHVSPENSARLQEAMILDAISKFNKINDNIGKFIYYWDEGSGNIFKKLLGDNKVNLRSQNGKDRTERFINSFNELFDMGMSKVIFIVTDSPTMNAEYIHNAFKELSKSDLVIGPSIDGGFCLMGFKKEYFPLFYNMDLKSIAWCADTVEIVKKNKLKLSLLNIQYDLDSIELLRFLKHHLKLLSVSTGEYPVNTKKIIDEIIKP